MSSGRVSEGKIGSKPFVLADTKVHVRPDIGNAPDGAVDCRISRWIGGFEMIRSNGLDEPG